MFDGELGMVCDVFWRCASSVAAAQRRNLRSPTSLITCSVSLSFVSVIVSRSVSLRQTAH